ncbi:class I adenylate-forming enzyme family protein [Candidatus Poriferisocius sp.]|uniref:class I adenylate-forming enzyme family protein n=1 Tax=Candidatus Poriferisocius sp. TaxID=3101276 RepID=UPI003B5C6263
MNLLHDLLTSGPRRDDLIVAGGRRLSTEEVVDWVDRASAGLEVGRPTPFQLPTGPEAVVAYRACWRAGAVPVPLLPSDGGHQRSQAFAQLGLNRLFDPAEASNPVEPPPPADTRPDDRALIMFTSGSSGVPKGVIHTQATLDYKVRQYINMSGLTSDDAVLFPASLAHVSGLLHGVLIPGALSLKAVLMARWDPGQALGLIEQEHVTYMVGPPTFFNDLMDHPDFSPERTASLRFLSVGGATVTAAFVHRARAAFGCVVKRAYGSTEAPTVTTATTDDDPRHMAETDGRPFPPTRIRIGQDLEIQVKGPEVAVGYLDPAQTAAAFTDDGWFRTGDVGRIDADGRLIVTGRLGRRIIRGGENIDAAEVERLLEAHPQVRQAVVLGVPDERLGERVTAFVVTEGEFDREECRRWFSQRGAPRFMCPEQVVPVTELPRMASGKPDPSALARMLDDPAR